MKPEVPPRAPDDDALHQLLHEWRVDASLSPWFATRVRQSLRQGVPTADASQGWSAIRSALADTVLDWLRRPRFVLAYGALVIALGAGFGAWQGNASSTAMTAGLQGRYIQSIDPYAGIGR